MKPSAVIRSQLFDDAYFRKVLALRPGLSSLSCRSFLGRISALIGWLEWYLHLVWGGKPSWSERTGLGFSWGLSGEHSKLWLKEGWGLGGGGSWLSRGPIFSVQRPSLRTQTPVSSVRMPPVLDARTAAARCLLPLPCRMLPVLAAPSTLPPEWWIEERTTWGGPAPDSI